MIFGISGKINSGKDTLFAMMVALDPRLENKKFAYKLKQIASILTGVPAIMFEDRDLKNSYMGDQWGMTYREFLQKLGTEGMRNGVHTNAWVNALFADYAPADRWVITDVRFPNEAQAVLDHGGVLIRVNRSNNPVQPSYHASETGLDNWTRWNYVIDNSGTLSDLEYQASRILSGL
jgi:hypothetical protein